MNHDVPHLDGPAQNEHQQLARDDCPPLDELFGQMTASAVCAF